MELEKQLFGKPVCAGRRRDMGHRVDSDLNFSHHTWPMFFAGISGDGFVPGMDPLSEFFKQLRGR